MDEARPDLAAFLSGDDVALERHCKRASLQIAELLQGLTFAQADAVLNGVRVLLCQTNYVTTDTDLFDQNVRAYNEIYGDSYARRSSQ